MDAGEPRDGDELFTQDLVPQGFDGRNLREEAVSADIEAEALVLRGPRNAADDVVGFEDRDPSADLES